MENINIQIGARIRARRKDLGMTQSDLANAAGITFQQVQKYENGANALYASRLYQLTKILEVPVSYFFEDTKDLGIATNDSHSLLTDKDCVKIMTSFQQITHPTTRKRLAAFIRSVAKS